MYRRVEPVARIALLSAGPKNPLVNEFLKQSVFFETKVVAHLDKGIPLGRFKVLVVPADLPRLSAGQKAHLDEFRAAGGVTLAAGRAEHDIVAGAITAAGGPSLMLEPRSYVLGQLTRKPGGQGFILHLLNYDHQTPANDLKVRLDLSGEGQDLSRWQVNALSPDAQPQLTGLSMHESFCEFTLSRIEHYTVVTLTAPP